MMGKKSIRPITFILRRSGATAVGCEPASSPKPQQMDDNG